MKKNLIKCILLSAISLTLLGCSGKKEEPITDKEESTIIKNAKDTDAFLKKKDYKSIAYAFIYNIKEGLTSYESHTTGTVKAKVAFFDYNIVYDSVTHKKGSAFYSKDHSKSTFTTLDNEFYQADREKILASRDLKKYDVYTIEEYNKASYAMSQYLVMGYVFNDQSIINTEVVSDKGDDVSIKYTLDNELATKFVKTDMKINGSLSAYPKFETINITLTMKRDFTPVSYAIDAVYEASAPVIGAARTTQAGECIFSKVNENITVPNESFLAEKLGADVSKIVINDEEEAIKEDLKGAFKNLDFANGVNVQGRLVINMLGSEIGLDINANATFDLDKISGDKIYEMLELYAKLQGDETFNSLISLVKSFAGDKLGEYAKILDDFKSVEIVYDGDGALYFLPVNNSDVQTSVVKMKLVDIVDIVLKRINVSSLVNGAMSDSFTFKKIPGNSEKDYKVEVTLNEETINKIRESINTFFENETYAMLKTILGYKDFDSIKVTITVEGDKASKIDGEVNYLKEGTEEKPEAVTKLLNISLNLASKKYDFTNDVARAKEQYDIYNSILNLKSELTYLSENIYATRSCLEKVKKGIQDYEALSEKQKEFMGTSIINILQRAKTDIEAVLAFAAVVEKYDLNNITNEDILNISKALSEGNVKRDMLKDLFSDEKMDKLNNLGNSIDFSILDGALSKMLTDDENAWGLTEAEVRGIKVLVEISNYDSSVTNNIMIRFLMLGKLIDMDVFKGQINNLYNKLG